MSVLKIKDENEQWTSIPTIKGETGDAAGFGAVTATVDSNHGTPMVRVTTSGGNTAKNFAFAFSNLQPAPYDDSELQNDFEVLQGQFDTAVAAVTTDTEVTDIRVGADGVTDTTAGASVRRQFTDLKNSFDDFKSSYLEKKYEWIRGTLIPTTGAYYEWESGQYRAVSEFIPVGDLYGGQIRVVDGYKYFIFFYDKDKGYLYGANYPSSTQGYWGAYTNDFDIFGDIGEVNINKADIGYIRLRMEDAISATTVVPLADAEKTIVEGTTVFGELISEVSTLKSNESRYAKLPSPNNYGEVGQALKSTGDGTVWAYIGEPTDSQVSIAVANWMDAHPEDRALIDDGSITLDKLQSGTLGYVSPEMFGATGDGVADDSNAINQCLSYCATYGCGLVGTAGKTYIVKNTIVIRNPINIDFNGAVIKYDGLNAITDFIEYGVDSNSIINYYFGIKNAVIDGNNKCDNVLHISGGKGVYLENIRIANPLVCGLLLNESYKSTWELTATNIYVSAANGTFLGQANYCIKIADITDSYFSNIICANGSSAWMQVGIGANANVIDGFHGYSYPTTLHAAVGLEVLGDSNSLSKITIDSPYNVGIKNAGNNNAFQMIFQYSVLGTVGDRVCINDTGDYSTYDGIRVRSDCDVIVKTEVVNYLNVSNVCCMGSPAYDFVFVNGVRPTKFVYDNSAVTVNTALS